VTAGWVLAAAAIVAACATPDNSGTTTPSGGRPSPNPAAPPILLATDSGRRFNAESGSELFVRLGTGGHRWDDLEATGPATVDEVLYRSDPGYREWRVMVSGSGQIVLTATCHGQCAGDFSVELDVVRRHQD
jgi:hypothetical protein